MGEHTVVATGRDVFRSRAFADGVVQSVIWAVLGVVALIAVPKFERIYADFGYGDARLNGAKLPNTTVAIISFTHVLRRFWYLALPLVCCWPFVNFGVVSLLSPRPEVVIPRRLWYDAMWVVLFLVIMFAVLALFRPLVVLGWITRVR